VNSIPGVEFDEERKRFANLGGEIVKK